MRNLTPLLLFSWLSHSTLALPSDQNGQEPLAFPAPDRPRAHHTRQHISPSRLENLTSLAALVDIAYCVGAPAPGISKPFKCPSRCAQFPDVELVTTWSSGALLTDSSGYLALDHSQKRIIVAFRGTYSIGDVIADLSTNPQQYVPYGAAKCDQCMVHAGFLSSWLDTAPTIKPKIKTLLEDNAGYTLEVLGHSLGGSLALLASLDFVANGWSNVRTTTFGQPKVGNKQLSDYVNEVLVNEGKLDRVTRTLDPVPLLPLTEWDYFPTAGELFINKDSLDLTPEDILICIGDTDLECSASMDPSLQPSTHQSQDDSQHKTNLLEALKSPFTDLTHIPNLPSPHHQSKHQKKPSSDARPTADTDLESRFATESFDIAEDVQDTSFIPIRYRLWQLFFAHRDYLVRVGLCVGPPSLGIPDIPLPDVGHWSHKLWKKVGLLASVRGGDGRSGGRYEEHESL